MIDDVDLTTGRKILLRYNGHLLLNKTGQRLEIGIGIGMDTNSGTRWMDDSEGAQRGKGKGRY